MQWLRRGSGQKDKEALRPADEARGALAELRQRIAQEFRTQQWGAVNDDIMTALQLLRESSAIAPITQSVLAELYSQWAIAINEQRRYEEAYNTLRDAERLLNMEIEEATAWAAEREITLDGQGDEPDLALVLRVLIALSENAARFDDPDTGRIIQEMVTIADLARDEPIAWLGRSRLATWATEQQDWTMLLALGRAMASIAQRQQSLPRLLEAMRQFTEAYIGRGETARAIESQTLVVDIARSIQHPGLEQEIEELRTLLESGR